MSLAYPRKRPTRANLHLVMALFKMARHHPPRAYLYLLGRGLDEDAYFACASPVERHFPDVFRACEPPANGGAGRRLRFSIKRPEDLTREDTMTGNWIVTRAHPCTSDNTQRFLRRLGVKSGDPIAWKVEAA